ncbi:MAG: LCP family protein [Clostridia bacterium]|nr:LCP family protein [Clostridia bacterium]
MRRLRWFALAGLLTLALLLTGSALGDRAPNPIEIIPEEAIPPVMEGQHHYLLLCTDVWHGNPGNLGNTDGIVLVTLDTRAHRVMLTSIIRDALVWRPMEENPEEYGFGRINYIAKRLGPEALCKVISQHINVRVEDYLLFDFTQIANIVDFLGGVDIELNASEISYLQRYAVPDGSVRSVKTGVDLRSGGTHRPGLYHFSGHSAVIYMRIRKAGGGGDFMRTQRARTVMSTLADKCREITWEEAEALVNNVMDNNTMTNVNLEGMLDAARYAYSLRDCTIEELRLPPDGAVTPITFASMAVQEIDWERCREAMADYLKNSFLVVEDED